MKVRYAETALRELDGIFAYLHERNRSAAVAVVDRIERLVELIGELPFIGHLTDEEGIRMMPVVRYPFLIFYAVSDTTDEVVILHIRHAARLRPGQGE
ncbi:MAG: type II toxin-antitoxin system RelE/ParE family toxin [Proteobacteria bacterium]|nr:type II toxin-antitoxin system RelE/ParE family toxin [Pseudomonadota bacterium]